MAALRPFYESDKSKDELTALRIQAGLDFDPFVDEGPANPWYQTGDKAPYNSPHYKCMAEIASNEPELPHTVRYLDEMEREIDGETLDALMEIGAGASEVTAYRVMPADKDELNPGDWISLSKEAAEGYLKASEEASHIVERKVPADHIFWDRQDAKAFGYDPRGRAPERDIPSHQFTAVFEVISRMERDHHNTGAFQADDIKRIEKFYFNPETREKLSRILKGRLEENPFTGEPFERAMLDTADMFAFDTLDPLLIYAADKSMKGNHPEVDKAIDLVMRDQDAVVEVYAAAPARLKDSEALRPGDQLYFSKEAAKKLAEASCEAGLDTNVVPAQVSGRHIFWDPYNTEPMAFWYEPRVSV